MPKTLEHRTQRIHIHFHYGIRSQNHNKDGLSLLGPNSIIVALNPKPKSLDPKPLNPKPRNPIWTLWVMRQLQGAVSSAAQAPAVSEHAPAAFRAVVLHYVLFLCIVLYDILLYSIRKIRI